MSRLPGWVIRSCEKPPVRIIRLANHLGVPGDAGRAAHASTIHPLWTWTSLHHCDLGGTNLQFHATLLWQWTMLAHYCGNGLVWITSFTGNDLLMKMTGYLLWLFHMLPGSQWRSFSKLWMIVTLLLPPDGCGRFGRCSDPRHVPQAKWRVRFLAIAAAARHTFDPMIIHRDLKSWPVGSEEWGAGSCWTLNSEAMLEKLSWISHRFWSSLRDALKQWVEIDYSHHFGGYILWPDWFAYEKYPSSTLELTINLH